MESWWKRQTLNIFTSFFTVNYCIRQTIFGLDWTGLDWTGLDIAVSINVKLWKLIEEAMGEQYFRSASVISSNWLFKTTSQIVECEA